MHERIKELGALNILQKTNGAQKFGEAAVKAGLGPVIFAGSLIAHPVDTTQNTVAGVGQFFNGVGAGLNNMGKSRDDAIASITGNRGEAPDRHPARRRSLYGFQTPCRQVGRSRRRGRRRQSRGRRRIHPDAGAAGAVAANTSTASTLNRMVKDYSAAQLMDMNREKLVRLGVSSATAERLLVNRNYTPLDVTAMVEALASMGAVKNVDAMVAGAASADSRDKAYFIRRRIELTAAYQRRTHSIVAFANPDDPLGVTERERCRRLSNRRALLDSGDGESRRGDDLRRRTRGRDRRQEPRHHRHSDPACREETLASRGWKVRRARSLDGAERCPLRECELPPPQEKKNRIAAIFAGWSLRRQTPLISDYSTPRQQFGG